MHQKAADRSQINPNLLQTRPLDVNAPQNLPLPNSGQKQQRRNPCIIKSARAAASAYGTLHRPPALRSTYILSSSPTQPHGGQYHYPSLSPNIRKRKPRELIELVPNLALQSQTVQSGTKYTHTHIPHMGRERVTQFHVLGQFNVKTQTKNSTSLSKELPGYQIIKSI